jgi:hypothetical protein
MNQTLKSPLLGLASSRIFVAIQRRYSKPKLLKATSWCEQMQSVPEKRKDFKGADL